MTPESIAGVSEKMVSVGSSSDRLGMLKAGNLKFEVLPHRVPSGSNSPLSGFVEGFLNGLFFDPAKIGPEFLKVNGLRCDSIFVLSKVRESTRLDESVLNSPLKIAKFIYSGVMDTV